MRLWGPFRELETIAWSWSQTKELVEHSFKFSFDALHVISGVLMLLGSAWLLRKPVSNWQPCLVVLAVAITNELADLSIDRWPNPEIQYGETVKDLMLTMLLPTVLLLSCRSLPWLYVRPTPGKQTQCDN